MLSTKTSITARSFWCADIVCDGRGASRKALGSVGRQEVVAGGARLGRTRVRRNRFGRAWLGLGSRRRRGVRRRGRNDGARRGLPTPLARVRQCRRRRLRGRDTVGRRLRVRLAAGAVGGCLEFARHRRTDRRGHARNGRIDRRVRVIHRRLGVGERRLGLFGERARLLQLGLDGAIELITELTCRAAEIADRFANLRHDLGSLAGPNTIRARTTINRSSIGPMPRKFISRDDYAVLSRPASISYRWAVLRKS